MSTAKRLPMRIKIIVYDIKTEEAIREHTTDYSKTESRLWLQRLCIWAWTNGHSVETFNIKDDA